MGGVRHIQVDTVVHDLCLRSGLAEYLAGRSITKVAMCSDGALLRPGLFPVASMEVTAAVLFVDLTGYSRASANLIPAECAYLASQFFAWFEAEAIRPNNGIIDQFVGDEVMVVFPMDACTRPPLEAALRTANSILFNDPYAFEPKIGIACGPIAVAVVGTESTASVTAMGQTVNLAARCVQTIGEPSAVRVATRDLDIVRQVFVEEDYWEVSQPTPPDFKNIGVTQVVDIRRQTRFVPTFDHFAEIRRAVNQAKQLGVVK